MSTNIPTTAASSANAAATTPFSNKSCYRLYAGHGNWINLNAKTTQDLLNIFEKGEPCRYQLAAGLFIDIIPNDVDCNSKNIDMIGLMRADLVYEPQMTENHVQQLMSHYIRSLLDEQGIIDAFPPLRQGEDLPIITSIPTHRHLSLVPSVVGTVRRGPKSSSLSSSTANQQRKTASISASSSVSMAEDDHPVLSSASSSSATHDSITNVNASNRKRAISTSAVTTRRSHLKRNRQNSSNVDSIELLSHHPKRNIMSLELPNLNSAAMNNSIFTGNAASSLNMSSFMDHGNHGNGNNNLLGYPHQHNNHQQQQHQQFQHNNTNNANLWISSYQSSPTPTNTRSSSGFNFEFGIDFDHALQPQQQQQHHYHHQQQHQKQSPTNILHEYDTNNFSHQIMTHEHHLYSNNTAAAAAAATAITPTTVTQMNHVDHSHLLNDSQQQQHYVLAAASSSDATSLESLVPVSPIPTSWLENNHNNNYQSNHQIQHSQHQQRDNSNWGQHDYASSNHQDANQKTVLTTTPLDPSSVVSNDLKKFKFEFNETAAAVVGNTTITSTTTSSTTTTSLPAMDLVDTNNDSKGRVFLPHSHTLSCSPSSSSSSSPLLPSSSSSSPIATTASQ